MKKKQESISVDDVSNQTSWVFNTVDKGNDVFLVQSNHPKYVVLDYKRFLHMLEEIEDLNDIKAINKCRKSGAETEPWETFKKRFE